MRNSGGLFVMMTGTLMMPESCVVISAVEQLCQPHEVPALGKEAVQSGWMALTVQARRALSANVQQNHGEIMTAPIQRMLALYAQVGYAYANSGLKEEAWKAVFL